MCYTGSKMVKMAQNGPKWPKIALFCIILVTFFTTDVTDMKIAPFFKRIFYYRKQYAYVLHR